MRPTLRQSLHGLSFVCTLIGAVPGALAAQGRTEPVLIESNQTDVLILRADGRDEVEERARLSALVLGCRERLAISSADSADFVSAPMPTLRADASARGRLVLAVLPDQARLVDCGAAAAQLSLAATRGLRVTTDTTYAADRDILQVIVRRGATVLEPLDTQRTPVRRLGPGGLRTPGAGWIQLAFDATVFAPNATGEVADLSIEVRTAAGGIAERIPLPWSAVRPALESVIIARRPTLPIARLTANGTTARARVAARASSAVTLLQEGDTDAARIVFGGLLSAEPCFTLALDAGAPARGLLGAMRRPAARCTPQRPVITFARAALLPGFGRPVAADARLRHMALTAAIATSGLMAMQQSRAANQRYEAYLAKQFVRPTLTGNPPVYDIIYAQAEDARLLANGLGVVSVALWGTQVAHALWRERRYAAHLADVQGVQVSPASHDAREAPSIGFGPLVGADRVGIVGRITW